MSFLNPHLVSGVANKNTCPAGTFILHKWRVFISHSVSKIRVHGLMFWPPSSVTIQNHVWPPSSVWPYKSAEFSWCTILLHFKMHICFEVHSISSLEISSVMSKSNKLHLQMSFYPQTKLCAAVCHISSVSGSFKMFVPNIMHHHLQPKLSNSPFSKI